MRGLAAESTHIPRIAGLTAVAFRAVVLTGWVTGIDVLMVFGMLGGSVDEALTPAGVAA